MAIGAGFTMVVMGPWIGLRQETYLDVDALNAKVKPILEKLVVYEKPVSDKEVDEKELPLHHIRGRRCSVARQCPGFLLDTQAPDNVYICSHCRLPRRMHDLED